MKSERDLFFISVFTFITICAWIFFELVKTTNTSTVTSTTTQLVTPLTPSLDTDTLNILSNKKQY